VTNIIAHLGGFQCKPFKVSRVFESKAKVHVYTLTQLYYTLGKSLGKMKFLNYKMGLLDYKNIICCSYKFLSFLMLNPYRIFESGARKQTGENLKVVWAKFFNSKLGSFSILQRECMILRPATITEENSAKI